MKLAEDIEYDSMYFLGRATNMAENVCSGIHIFFMIYKLGYYHVDEVMFHRHIQTAIATNAVLCRFIL